MRGTSTFIDSINDSVRILIILKTASRAKSNHLMTENRIRLYDYYLRFPNTMFGIESVIDEGSVNFDEYYAFFHWKPDVVRYRSCINYLIARGLIEKKLTNANIVFTVLPKGVDALSKIENRYKEKLVGLTERMLPLVSKLSDKKIEEEITKKANSISQEMGDKIHGR